MQVHHDTRHHPAINRASLCCQSPSLQGYKVSGPEKPEGLKANNIRESTIQPQKSRLEGPCKGDITDPCAEESFGADSKLLDYSRVELQSCFGSKTDKAALCP